MPHLTQGEWETLAAGWTFELDVLAAAPVNPMIVGSVAVVAFAAATLAVASAAAAQSPVVSVVATLAVASAAAGRSPAAFVAATFVQEY